MTATPCHAGGAMPSRAAAPARAAVLLLACATAAAATAATAQPPHLLPRLLVTAPGLPAWSLDLERRLQAIDAGLAGGDIGVYVLHLERRESYAYRADEPWYLASGVKIPVAIAVMRAVEDGELSLDTRIALRETDFVDGAGGTNRHPAGARLTVAYLLEQMVVFSDNTASDVLIRSVGLERVNAVAADLIDAHMRITTLGDVRRLAYAQFHPGASRLTAQDLLALQRSPAGQARVNRLAQLLAVTPNEFMQPDLTSAFEAYYATHLNSATLVDYGRMLATLAEGQALGDEGTRYLLDLMARVQTGKQRIVAGLPRRAGFAHKTGTQYRRTCDLGIATVPAATRTGPPARVVIAACVRGTGTAAGERALRDIGAAVTASGVFVDSAPQPTVSPILATPP
ncbi:serine hydrolase [Pseudoxanthomonas suwonensis]|uniref:serine hydrolase n=1 Tax=Pseudoxanthomonas suwonensis TaxID=314722 RepID=UPI001F217CB8|nr:serine hydrolase [Pseudoxanthomonas suwonensis]